MGEAKYLTKRVRVLASRRSQSRAFNLANSISLWVASAFLLVGIVGMMLCPSAVSEERSHRRLEGGSSEQMTSAELLHYEGLPNSFRKCIEDHTNLTITVRNNPKLKGTERKEYGMLFVKGTDTHVGEYQICFEEGDESLFIDTIGINENFRGNDIMRWLIALTCMYIDDNKDNFPYSGIDLKAYASDSLPPAIFWHYMGYKSQGNPWG